MRTTQRSWIDQNGGYVRIEAQDWWSFSSVCVFNFVLECFGIVLSLAFSQQLLNVGDFSGDNLGTCTHFSKIVTGIFSSIISILSPVSEILNTTCHLYSQHCVLFLIRWHRMNFLCHAPSSVILALCDHSEVLFSNHSLVFFFIK